MNSTPIDEGAKGADPDELEALADERESEALSLRARAKRLRMAQRTRTGLVIGEWIALTKGNDARVREEFGFGVRTPLDAGKRGELVVHRAGKGRGRPRVLRLDLEAWLRANPVKPKVAIDPGEDDEAVYRKIAGGAR